MELSSTFRFENWEIKYTFEQPKDNHQNQSYQPTVVFVHGTPWSSAVFKPLAEAILARGRYRVLLYDLAGYGESQRLHSKGQSTSEDTSVKSQAALLATLLRHLALDGENGPDIIAHDIAGSIALRTHLIHGCKYNSLFLLDTNAVLPWGDGFYKLARSDPETFQKLPPKIFEAVVRAVIRSACFNPSILDSGWEDILAQPWVSRGNDREEKQHSFMRQIVQANDADVAEMLDGNLYERVGCPVKVIWGSNDEWIPREKMDRLATMLTHCLKEFVVVPNAGHLVMIDQPVRVAAEILCWLDANQ